MENAIVVNNESVTIKITIEVIPSKKKEPVVEVPSTVAKEPITVATPKGWDSVEPENPPLVPPVVPEPEKKKRAYTPRKAKTTEPVVEEKKVETPVVEKPVEEVKPPVVPPVTTASHTSPPTPNKVVARLAQMIRFYCKASNIPTTEITKKYLIDHGAADIIEGATDEDIEEAFQEVVKK